MSSPSVEDAARALSLPVAQLARAFAQGTLTSRALVDAALARIRLHDAALGAFLSVDEASARAQASAADERRARGAARGPLDGIPVGLKDNLALEGAPLTAGSRILEGFVAPYDATVTRKLKDAGAVLLGRLNCDEFAMGSSTENSAFQATRNPWDLARVPGGSSGGSAAAVAARMLPLTLGSDTGGSIRQPAALCGVVGLKPSWGRVSRFGLVAFASSLDVVGPFARDVRSAALLLQTLAGLDARDGTSDARAVPSLVEAAEGGAAGLRVGVPRTLLDRGGLHADVARALADAEAALARAGASFVDVELPLMEQAVACYYVIAMAEAASNLARFDGVRYGPRRGEERGLQAMMEETRALFGPEVKRRIVVGTWVLSKGYVDAYVHRAQRVRRRIAEGLGAALQRCDVLLLPTSPEPAWPLGTKAADPLSMYLADAFTVPASLAGLPAASLNAGFGAGGLPLGVQLVGRAFDEATVVRAAAALEDALAIPDRVPPLLEAQS